jgi:hypothetical protein
MLDRLEQLDADVVCVSALPLFAARQAKSVCKQARQRCPKVKIVLGLWRFSGGGTKAQEKVGVSCTDAIATSLAQMVSLVGNLACSTWVPSDRGEDHP